MKITIYIIFNNINNKLYIGQTNNFNIRKNAHKNLKKSNTAIHNAINKYGWEKFNMQPLIIVDACLADICERAYIKYFNTLAPEGYNLVTGGNSKKCVSDVTRKKLSDAHKNHRATDLTKQKMSLAQIGKHRDKPSEQTKKRISAKLTGTKQSEETILKKTARLRGRKYPDRVISEETRVKMSLAKKGKALSEEHKINVSKSLKGKNTWSHNRKITAAHKLKIAEGVRLSHLKKKEIR